MILLGKRFDIFENGQKAVVLFGDENKLVHWARSMDAPSLIWLLAHGWSVERVLWDSMDAIQGSTQPLMGACGEEEHLCAMFSLNKFFCTLRKGHTGFHAAHTVSETHPVFAWSEVTG
jgi:hypothetical protein